MRIYIFNNYEILMVSIQPAQQRLLQTGCAMSNARSLADQWTAQFLKLTLLMYRYSKYVALRGTSGAFKGTDLPGERHMALLAGVMGIGRIQMRLRNLGPSQKWSVEIKN